MLLVGTDGSLDKQRLAVFPRYQHPARGKTAHTTGKCRDRQFLWTSARRASKSEAELRGLQEADKQPSVVAFVQSPPWYLWSQQDCG